MGDANQDWSRANSRDAGVELDEAEVAAFIILRYSYRRTNATAPFLPERNPAPLQAIWFFFFFILPPNHCKNKHKRLRGLRREMNI